MAWLLGGQGPSNDYDRIKSMMGKVQVGLSHISPREPPLYSFVNSRIISAPQM